MSKTDFLEMVWHKNVLLKSSWCDRLPENVRRKEATECFVPGRYMSVNSGGAAVRSTGAERHATLTKLRVSFTVPTEEIRNFPS